MGLRRPHEYLVGLVDSSVKCFSSGEYAFVHFLFSARLSALRIACQIKCRRTLSKFAADFIETFFTVWSRLLRTLHWNVLNLDCDHFLFFFVPVNALLQPMFL